MKIAIIALLISLAALGLGGFATVRTFNESHPTPPAVERQWSEEECATAKAQIEEGTLFNLAGACLRRQTPDSCTAYNDMIQAINNHCP
jgi:hypothetical protein